MSSAVLTMEGIVKTFPGVRALGGVDFELAAGEVHALMGENGAGKSTLMKVLGGVHQPDEGRMTLRGEPYEPRSPRDAQQRGIGFIHQELKLAENLSVAENVMLGRFPRGPLGLVRWDELRRRASAALEELELELPLDQPVGELNVGMQQMVEIAKTLALQASILIMDEPTAALSQKEAEHLFAVIHRLREQGKTIVYISHRMEEVYALSDRVTVLRDGCTVGTRKASEATPDEVVRLMVGRELKEQFPERHPAIGEEMLRIEGLSREGVLRDVSLTVRAGEIVGLAGLVGAGRTEIARAVIGADPIDAGKIFIQGREVSITRPLDSIREGLGYVTEDRKALGLVLDLSIEENVCLPNLRSVSRAGFVDGSAARELAERYVERMRIRTAGVEHAVKNLSGGNQQKVVMGKWLARNCRVLILDEPTRGVDVGAKAEIYALIEELSEKGVAILLISSELPELMGLSDRVLVIHQGRVAARFERGEATAEAIIASALTGAAS